LTVRCVVINLSGMTSRSFFTGLLAVLTPLLTHCGAGTMDACTLLTNTEVATAIGETVTRTESGASQTSTAYCHWYGDTTVLLSKGITILSNRSNGAELYNSYKALTPAATTPVSGLGDAAVTDGTTILVYSGNKFLSISPVYNGAGVTYSAVLSLAQTAMTRL